ncbi:hypothetical protein FS749_012882 [Ceratobasidium sp. UAMH 11750]|nr:hypothetical protein FS749_012882 [Ceratobasidium sp. UAMH 11750]
MDIEKIAGLQLATGPRRCPSPVVSVREVDRTTLDGGSCDMSEKGFSLESNVVQLDNPSSPHVASPMVVTMGVNDEGFIEGGFEGWKAVVGCSLISAPTVGWNLSWGVFQEYHSSHFLSTTPDATLSSVGAVQNALMAVVAFVAGKLGDRYGYKPFIGAGCLIVFIGQFSASWCNDFWSIFLTQGILQGLGCGLLLPMTFAIPSQWFRRHRGLATGIVIAGASLGGAVTSLVIQEMLTQLGFHRALLIYSFIQGLILIVGFSLIQVRLPSSPPSTQSQKIQWVDYHRLKDPIFWSFWLALCLTMFGYMNPFVFTFVYTREKLPGLHSPRLACLPISIMNFASAIGRTTVGFGADRIGFLNAFILTVSVSAFSQAVLWNLAANSYAGVMTFSVVFGLSGPCYISLITPVAVTLYGAQNLATLTGLLNLASLPGTRDVLRELCSS